MSRRQDYYYGSYGLLRGYGPLRRNLQDAQEAVYADSRAERLAGRISDRNVVLVSRVTGLCWWMDDVEIIASELDPVRTVDGTQAQYSLADVRAMESCCGHVNEQAGLG